MHVNKTNFILTYGLDNFLKNYLNWYTFFALNGNKEIYIPQVYAY